MTARAEVIPPAKGVQVIGVARPFSTVKTCLTVHEGQTIADIVAEATAGTPPAAINAHVWIGDPDGRADPIYIAREHWGAVRPKAGARLTLRVTPTGDGGGSNPLRMVAIIAVAVLAAYTGGLAAGALGLAEGSLAFSAVSGAVAFGVTMVGTLLINALIPPPKPQDALASGQSPQTAYAITGTQNRANRYGPVPRVYGRMRVFPPYAAVPYTEAQGRTMYLRLLFDFGYGPLDLSELRIGSTPIDQFEGVEYEIRQGYDSDPPITLYTRDVFEDQMRVKLSAAAGWQVVETRDESDEATFDIAFAALVEFRDDGSRKRRSVDFVAEYRAVGDATWLPYDGGAGTFTISARTDAAYREGLRIKFSAAGRYEVRVKRTTADTNDAQIRDEAYLVVLRSIAYEPPVRVEGHCLVAMRIKATDQLNGVVDSFNAIAEALLSTWNGIEWTTPIKTRNPAWAYADVLRGSANPNPISDSRIDGDSLLAWAQACDAAGPVSEPRWTFDGVVDFKTTVFDLLRDIAAVGRASPTMLDGRFAVVRDTAQATPVQVFTPRNSWGFRATKAFGTQPHGLRVRYIEPDREWTEQEVTVYDDGYDSQTATNLERLDLRFGVTRRAQAWGEGRYHMAVNRLRPEIYEFSADIEHLVCTRGDLIRVAHDVPLWGGQKGRIRAITVDAGSVTHISLDERLTMEAGKLYTLRVRKADGAQAVYSVNTDTQVDRTVQLLTAIPEAEAPEVGDLVAFGEATRESVPLIVKAITPGADLSARLACVDAAPDVHDADQGEIPDFDPLITGPAPVPAVVRPEPPVVAEVVSDERAVVQLPGGGFVIRILVFLETRSDRDASDGFELHYRRSDSDEAWSRAPVVTGRPDVLEAVPVEEGEVYDLRLRAVSRLGHPSDWVLIDAHTVIGKSTRPPSPTALLVDRVPGGLLRYRWEHEQPVDHAGYRIRWAPGLSTKWDTAQEAHIGLITAAFWESPAFVASTFTVMVKAVDANGLESEDHAHAILKLGDPIPARPMATTDFAAQGWPGTITGGSVVSGEVVGQVEDALYFDRADPLYRDRDEILSDAYPELVYETEWTAGRRGDLYINVSAEGDPVVRYQPQGRTPLFTDPLDPLPDPLFEDGSPVNYLGPIAVESGETLILSARIPSGETARKITGMTAKVDAPLVTEYLDDIDIVGAGERLPTGRTWEQVLNVSLTVQESPGYGAIRATVVDKDTSGPLIRAYDENNASADALLDAAIQGIPAP